MSSAIEEADFNVFQDILMKTSGLVISPEKTYLLESRLNPVVKRWGMTSLKELAGKLKTNPGKDLVTEVMEAMTTNETSFFRDIKPYEQLKEVILPTIAERRSNRKTLRIWSAACSTGQEPYSIAMVLTDMNHLFANWNIEIFASDISNEVLEQAKNGKYSQFEVQRGLPIQYLVKHFSQDGNFWHIKDHIKNMVTFKFMNLLEPFTNTGKFDIVFCRNVLIYFNESTKTTVLNKIADVLEDDGMLLLGGAETVLGLSSRFIPDTERRGLYIKSL